MNHLSMEIKFKASGTLYIHPLCGVVDVNFVVVLVEQYLHVTDTNCDIWTLPEKNVNDIDEEQSR